MILWTLSQSTDGNAEDDDDREGLMDPSNDDGGVLNTRQTGGMPTVAMRSWHEAAGIWVDY